MSNNEEVLDLGLVLGQRRALVAVGGRCSAAHAQLLRRIRDEKLYRATAASWRDFCKSHLRLSRRHADRLIAALNQFGPAYFELSQLTGISPRQYRAIQPAVRDDTFLVEGEALSLIPKNAARITEAIDRLLQRKHSPSNLTVAARISSLAARGRAIANQFLSLYCNARTGTERELLLEAASEIRVILLQLGIDLPSNRRGA